MHESETKNEKVERFYRHLEHILSEVALGHDSQVLRRKLEVATMISPLTGPDQAAVLRRFDAAVELVDQLDNSFKARTSETGVSLKDDGATVSACWRGAAARI